MKAQVTKTFYEKSVSNILNKSKEESKEEQP